jgi:hypothetical protein
MCGRRIERGPQLASRSSSTASARMIQRLIPAEEAQKPAEQRHQQRAAEDALEERFDVRRRRGSSW